MAPHTYLRAGKLGLLRAVFLTAAALVAVPEASHAQLISYTFTPGTSATFPAGPTTLAGTALFSGGFTFNTATNAVSNANIVLTGSAFAGTYNNPQAIYPGGAELLVLNPLNNFNMFLRFTSPLGTSFDALSYVDITVPGVGPVIRSSVSGGVTPSSVVPEPGTWALLGTGLIGVAGIARRKRAA